MTDAQIFFVMGADSWEEITTWREWETVLTVVNTIVVTRPNFEIEVSHIPEKIRGTIVDLRNGNRQSLHANRRNDESQIYFTDAVNLDVSATEIRRKIGASENDWRELVSSRVAKYIEKYELYT